MELIALQSCGTIDVDVMLSLVTCRCLSFRSSYEKRPGCESSNTYLSYSSSLSINVVVDLRKGPKECTEIESLREKQVEHHKGLQYDQNPSITQTLSVQMYQTCKAPAR